MKLIFKFYATYMTNELLRIKSSLEFVARQIETPKKYPKEVKQNGFICFTFVGSFFGVSCFVCSAINSSQASDSQPFKYINSIKVWIKMRTCLLYELCFYYILSTYLLIQEEKNLIKKIIQWNWLKFEVDQNEFFNSKLNRIFLQVWFFRWKI